MGNGVNRLFNVMKKTSDGAKTASSKLVSLKVKSINPLTFQLDDRLDITEEFCYFSNSADKDLLNVGDVVVAVALNEGQTYYIQHNLDGLLTTVAELNFLQGATDNIQHQLDVMKTSGVATGDTLPIGTVVEFTGDEVPENWEAVTYNESIISSDEPTTGQEIWFQRGKNMLKTAFRCWERGHYSTTGGKAYHTARIRMKDSISITPNTTYYCSTFSGVYSLIIRAYDSSWVFVRNLGPFTDGQTFTTGANEKYIMVSMYDPNDETVNFYTYQSAFSNGTIKPFICLASEPDKSYEAYKYENIYLMNDSGKYEIFRNGKIEEDTKYRPYFTQMQYVAASTTVNITIASSQSMLFLAQPSGADKTPCLAYIYIDSTKGVQVSSMGTLFNSATWADGILTVMLNNTYFRYSYMLLDSR